MSASKKNTRPATPPAPPPLRSQDALRRLQELTARQVAPDRVRREVEGMVKTWLEGAGEGKRQELRDKLDEMAGELAEGLEALQEEAGDMGQDDHAGRRHATNAAACLRAARDAMLTADLGA